MRNETMFRRRKKFRFDALVFAVVTTMLGLMLPIAAFAQRFITAKFASLY